nr:nucleoplasmin-2 isoform X4 [Callithrix jacchus]
MNLSSTSSTEEKAVTTVLWGCELSQERRTWTFRPQPKGKQDCKLLLHTICLGEKAKEEMHRVEILPPGNREDKKTQPVTIASLQASVLPMVRLSMLVGKLPPAPASPSPFGGEWTHTRVTMVGVQLSPPITFQLRAGSGPVFLSGHERYETSDLTWEEEEEEEGEEDEEEEEEEDDEDEDVDISLEEESPVKQGKRLVPQKPTSVAKKKKLEKEQEEVRPKPYPDPKSQDSRNEELRLGGHDAEWAFPGLCCREGAPLPHPCICLNVTAVLWGQHKSPSPPTLHFQEAPSKDPRLWSQ